MCLYFEIETSYLEFFGHYYAIVKRDFSNANKICIITFTPNSQFVKRNFAKKYFIDSVENGKSARVLFAYTKIVSLPAFSFRKMNK